MTLSLEQIYTAYLNVRKNYYHSCILSSRIHYLPIRLKHRCTDGGIYGMSRKLKTVKQLLRTVKQVMNDFTPP